MRSSLSSSLTSNMAFHSFHPARRYMNVRNQEETNGHQVDKQIYQSMISGSLNDRFRLSLGDNLFLIYAQS